MDTAKFKELVDILLTEAEEVPGTTPAPKTSDVKTLVKYIETKEDFLNKLKNVSNGQEVTEFLEFILNSINDKVSGVNKNNLIKIINSRFK